MRKILISLLLILVSFRGITQSIDSVNLKILYQLSYRPDSIVKNKYKTDIFVLLAGEHVSHFYSRTKYLQDSLFEESNRNGTIEKFISNPSIRNKYGVVGPYSYAHIYINYLDNQITVIDQIFGGDKFVYKEMTDEIGWEIKTEIDTILSYPCQKALTNFRGRIFTAWFSNQIPINKGPYKFHGLPGLILKIEDVDKNYVYECISVEKQSIKSPITLKINDCIKTNRLEFMKLLKESFANPFEFLKNKGVTIISNNSNSVNNNPITTSSNQKLLPFNPIELK